VNTSLVFCVLALSSSWTPPSTAPDIDPSAVFAHAEPIGLFDEVTAPEPEAVDKRPTNEFWSAYNAANFGSSVTHRQGSRTRRFPSLLRAHRDAIIRGQSPEVRLADGMRQNVPRTYAPSQNPVPVPSGSPSNVPSSTTTQTQPFSSRSNEEYEPPIQTQPVEPFFQSPSPAPFMTAPPPGIATWGANGPQPYRLGYSLWGDLGFLPNRPVSLPGGGKFSVFEANVGLNHTIPTWWAPWLFSLEHQFGYRDWSGPDSTETTTRTDLPASVYRFGWDIRFETPLNSQFAPFALTLAFNPSINSDFDQHLTRNAYNFDGRGVLLWQLDPRFQVALGAGFWDRVHDRIIPYAGFVWLPDDRWEFRIMWPQSRIQYYCGNYMGEDVWLYATGEYHIESYQIGSSAFVPPPPLGGTVVNRVDQVELEDYRILIGLRKSNPIVSGFIEGGWVFGRRVDQRFGPDFNINTGFIGRVGIRF
jgi:hypothetical protein